MTTWLKSNRRGMTLPELLIALVIFSAVMAGVLSVLNRENRAMWRATQRMNALQNLRYAADEMEQELRTAGAVTLTHQPFVVYADTHIFAFNANYVTNTVGDPFAVYYDPDAPDQIAQALTKAQRFTFPATSFTYPDTSYNTGPPAYINSSAETIIFFFQLDTSTTRTDDYVLYRKVNNEVPEVVSRNLLPTAGTPWFQYTRLVSPPSAPQYVAAVPANQLPLRHTVKVHLAPGDTGTAARVDSVRGVRITLTATNGLTGAEERRRTVTRMIRLPNAGLTDRQNCGDEPLLGAFTFTATLGALVTGEIVINLAWTQAQDEASGEADVARYVIWRRTPADPPFTDLDPYLSIPAGNLNYVYTDVDVVSGETYFYAIAAQDCTPSLSSLRTAGPVVIP